MVKVKIPAQILHFFFLLFSHQPFSCLLGLPIERPMISYQKYENSKAFSHTSLKRTYLGRENRIFEIQMLKAYIRFIRDFLVNWQKAKKFDDFFYTSLTGTCSKKIND